MWNVPYDRHANFVGRRNLLEALVAPTGPGAGTAARAITGPGGVGKTQLAVEYAHTHRHDFDLVWWVRAEQATTLRGDLARLGQVLGLRAAGADLDMAAREVRAWLERHDRWMVVFDNATDAHAVRTALPTGGSGQVLVTSRGNDWAPAATVLEVDVLGEDEAVEYLLRSTGETGRAPALALARALGCLPLALEKAAAYVAQSPGLGLGGYLDVFRARVGNLQPDRPAYPAAVAVTCALAVERVEEVSPVAATLLRACAFLAPEAVPVSLLSDVDELPEPLAAGPMAQRDALAALSGLGLVRSTWPGGIAVDRVVQAAVRDHLPGDRRRTWAAGVVRLMERAFPADSHDVATWDRCGRLVPHALAVTRFDEAADLEPQATSRLLAGIGIYLHGRGQLAEARRLLERAVAITEVAYGLDAPETGIHLGNLGLVLQDAGELVGARACLERAVGIAEAAHGPEHPAVGTFVANLGGVLADLGEHSPARVCFERALAIDVSVYGPDHPTVAGDLNNVALVLWSDGEAAEAYRCFGEALAIDQATFGPDDPTVARDAANLALVLADAGESAEARRGLERALAIVESAFGPGHPEVATHLTNLALVLQDCGELAAARGCLERALAVAQDAHGPEHPAVAGVLNNLGGVLSHLGDNAGGRRCFERALAIDEAALGIEHGEVGAIRDNRAALRRDLGTDA